MAAAPGPGVGGSGHEEQEDGQHQPDLSGRVKREPHGTPVVGENQHRTTFLNRPGWPQLYRSSRAGKGQTTVKGGYFLVIFSGRIG